ncbi:uncharacterized protein LOC127835010 [Dreissena polymorpha]|uniref:uncharacterized protein LOC127835010 n=1 Tax=Dreissena polymorpha TaxID=45954 RepID=UPI0022649F9D|nr:uncharacterized protein LOC127835010 [Dreissena polymorpha]
MIINHLLYADDLILIAETESDLQILLDILGSWCTSNKMTINTNKSKIMHFRNKNVKTNYRFTCNNNELECVTEYRYLGLVLSEFLDYSVTAKYVAKSATRALGLLISKFKSLGGMPYNIYTKLYDSIVWPTISYGAAIWGTQDYASINAVHHRVCRFYLGVGKYTPNAGITGDMGWLSPYARQWKSILTNWFRLNSMDNNRINYKVFKWSYIKIHHTNNWHHKICMKVPLDISYSYSTSERKYITNNCIDDLFNDYKAVWLNNINREQAAHGRGGNKLRTYKLFKQTYNTESYVNNIIIPRSHRSAFAKFRCVVAPLKIETGRYQGIVPNERFCFNCINQVEDEYHVLMSCNLYEDIREKLFTKIFEINPDFSEYSDDNKFCYI